MERVFTLIKDLSGLNLNQSHKKFIALYLTKRIEQLSLSMDDYLSLLKKDNEELKILIDEAAINETYFFREEQQFDFLKNYYLPKHKNEKIVAWSAASSSGEESISIYSLLKSEKYSFNVYASDIDSQVLKIFKKGQYFSNSFRTDGSRYRELLKEAGTLEEKSFTLGEEAKNAISIRETNLVTTAEFPFSDNSIDIIFIRNVFIYFDTDTRLQIIRKMEKKLKEGGIILFSMNEIASISVPDTSRLVKDHIGHVYFFRKLKSGEDKKSVQDAIKNASHPASQKTNDSAESKGGFSHSSGAVKSASADPLKKEWSKTTIPENIQASMKSTQSFLQKSLEKMAESFFTEINNGNLENASKIIRDFQFKAEYSEYRLYFEGIVAYEEGKMDVALECFKKAALLNPEFWPALIRSAVIYEKQDNQKETIKYFSFSQKAIQNYIKEEKVCYNFIVEEFSPAYFLNLCETHLNRSALTK